MPWLAGCSSIIRLREYIESWTVTALSEVAVTGVDPATRKHVAIM